MALKPHRVRYWLNPNAELDAQAAKIALASAATLFALVVELKPRHFSWTKWSASSLRVSAGTPGFSSNDVTRRPFDWTYTVRALRA